MNKRTVSYSRAIMSQVMLPHQANFEGNVHGGEIMKFMDNTAYVVARKHAKCNVVTARVDELVFHHPIYIGELITCRAELVFTGRSSMEIFVRVEVDDMETDQQPKTALTAYFTMVALDDNGKPTPVPGLILETPEEEAAFEEGRKRYERYKRLRGKEKSAQRQG